VGIEIIYVFGQYIAIRDLSLFSFTMLYQQYAQVIAGFRICHMCLYGLPETGFGLCWAIASKVGNTKLAMSPRGIRIAIENLHVSTYRGFEMACIAELVRRLDRFDRCTTEPLAF
jgi:hypothetical protein